MSKIKLLIEVDEEYYKIVKKFKEAGLRIPPPDEAIAEGKVLDEKIHKEGK